MILYWERFMRTKKKKTELNRPDIVLTGRENKTTCNKYRIP